MSQPPRKRTRSNYREFDAAQKQRAEKSRRVQEKVKDGYGNIIPLDVQHLDLSGLGFKVLPRLSSFTRLESIDLEGNQLHYLNGYDFDIETLKVLDVSHNQLNRIRFIKALSSSLETLNLSFNELTQIDLGGLNLASLIDLNLRGNGLDEINVAGMNTKNLIKLDLSENALSTLPSGLKFLRYSPGPGFNLDMSRNDLSGILEDEIGPAVTSLNLSDNNLSSLSARFIRSCFALKKLDLSGNHLKELPDGFGFESLHGLNHLNLEGNQLKKLPGSFCNLRLKTLSLRSNFLTVLPSQFGNLENLHDLDLSNNAGLKTLPESFGQLRNLVKLNLTNNPRDFRDRDHKAWISSSLTLTFPYSFLRSNLPLLESVDVFQKGTDYRAPSLEVYQFLQPVMRPNHTPLRLFDYQTRAKKFSKDIQQQKLDQGQPMDISYWKGFAPNELPGNFALPEEFIKPFWWFQKYKRGAFHDCPLLPRLKLKPEIVYLSVEDFKDPEKCFRVITDHDPVDFQIQLFKTNQQGFSIQERTIDVGAVQKQLFYHAGLYLKTQLSYDENVYKFKYGTSPEFISEVGYLMLVALVLGNTLDVPFSAGIIYYFLCILQHKLPTGTSSANYLGRLMFLADLDDCSAIRNLLGSISSERFGYLGQQTDETYKNFQQQRDVSYKVLPSLMAYRRSLERTVFLHTEGRVPKDTLEGYIRDLLYPALMEGMRRVSAKYTNAFRTDEKIPNIIRCYREFFLAELTEARMKAIPTYSDGTREDQALMKGYYDRFIEEHPEEWRNLLLFVTGTVLPSLGMKIQIKPDSAALPSTHSCFQQVMIPLYRTYEIFEEKLTAALRDTSFELE